MNALARLEAIGYDVSLKDDQIHLHYRKETDPDPTVVEPLLKIVESHKDEAIGLIRRKEEADDRFKQALHEIKGAYIPGLLPHIERKHPDLWKSIKEAEDRLEVVWGKILNGEPIVQSFQNAVDAWKQLHLQAIHEHRRRSCGECPVEMRARCRTH